MTHSLTILGALFLTGVIIVGVISITRYLTNPKKAKRK